MIYKYWLFYYLFIRNIYTRKWKDMSSSVISLAIACLVIIFLFIEVLLESIFNFNGFASFFSRGIPLAPVAMIIVFAVLLPIINNVSRKSIRNKSLLFRTAISRVNQISKYYTIIYLVLCFVLFVITILIILFNN